MNAPLSFPVQVPDAAAVARIAPELGDDERERLRARAKQLLRDRDAVLPRQTSEVRRNGSHRPARLYRVNNPHEVQIIK